MYVNVRTYVRRSVGRSVSWSVCLSVCVYMYTSEYVSIICSLVLPGVCVCVQCHCRDRATRTLSLSRWFPSNRIQPSSTLEQSEQLQLRSLLGEAKLPTTTKSNFDFSCSQISSVQIRNKYVPIVLWQQKFREWSGWSG